MIQEFTREQKRKFNNQIVRSEIKVLKYRLGIYKKSLKLACDDPALDTGLCHYICKAAGIGSFIMLNEFPELYQYCPRILHHPNYWFPPTQTGWKKRLHILERAIYKTERKIEKLKKQIK
jgi:hypothetical protein